MENKDSYQILDEVKLTADSDAITGKMIINATAGDPQTNEWLYMYLWLPLQEPLWWLCLS